MNTKIDKVQDLSKIDVLLKDCNINQLLLYPYAHGLRHNEKPSVSNRPENYVSPQEQAMQNYLKAKEQERQRTEELQSKIQANKQG